MRSWGLASTSRLWGSSPLGLEHLGPWDPAEHDWDGEGEPLDDWARPIHDRGPRPQYELPGLTAAELAGELDLKRPLNHGYLPRIYASARGDEASTSICHVFLK